MAIANLRRALFTVTRHDLGWCVEHEGQLFDASEHLEEVLASASRRARAANEKGSPAQVKMGADPSPTRIPARTSTASY